MITRDKFLHVLSGREECADLIATFNIKESVLKEYNPADEPLIEISECKTSGFFRLFSSPKKETFKFNDEEMKREWMMHFR